VYNCKLIIDNYIRLIYISQSRNNTVFYTGRSRSLSSYRTAGSRVSLREGNLNNTATSKRCTVSKQILYKVRWFCSVYKTPMFSLRTLCGMVESLRTSEGIRLGKEIAMNSLRLASRCLVPNNYMMTALQWLIIFQVCYHFGYTPVKQELKEGIKVIGEQYQELKLVEKAMIVNVKRRSVAVHASRKQKTSKIDNLWKPNKKSKPSI
jgi:hypothetical protein